MPDDESRNELLNTLEASLRAWDKDPSWKTFQPVRKTLAKLNEQKMMNESG